MDLNKFDLMGEFVSGKGSRHFHMGKALQIKWLFAMFSVIMILVNLHSLMNRF